MFNSVIPDYNRPPEYWLDQAKIRVQNAKAELKEAEEQFNILTMAFAERNTRRFEYSQK